MKKGREKGGIIAWHGTDRTDFTSFDVSQVAPYNVGLHFGTRAAAQELVVSSRTARDSRAAPAQESPSGDFRLLRCSLSISNLFRIPVDAIVSIASEADGKIPSDAFETNASTHDAFNRRLNVSLRNFFRSLGYDGFVYVNEIESPSDSYIIFSPRQVKILAAESVDATLSKGMAA